MGRRNYHKVPLEYRRTPISLKQWRWLTCLLGYDLGIYQLIADIGYTNYISVTPKAISHLRALLLDRICKERIKRSLADVLADAETVLCPEEIAEYLCFSTTQVRRLVDSFEKHSPVPFMKPYVFVYAKDLGNIFWQSAISRHVSRHPYWLWRQAESLTPRQAHEMLGISPRQGASLEAGYPLRKRIATRISKVLPELVAAIKQWEEEYKEIVL